MLWLELYVTFKYETHALSHLDYDITSRKAFSSILSGGYNYIPVFNNNYMLLLYHLGDGITTRKAFSFILCAVYSNILVSNNKYMLYII